MEEPSSLNLYTYCLNNPVMYVDPSGHSNAYAGEGGGSSSKCGSGNSANGNNHSSTNSQTGNAVGVNYPDMNSGVGFILGYDSGSGFITSGTNFVLNIQGYPAVTQEDIEYNIKNNPGFAEAYYAGQLTYTADALYSISGGAGKPQVQYSIVGGSAVAADSVYVFAPSISFNKEYDNTIDKQRNGTPGNNQAQNKQARDAANKYKLNEEQREQLHNEISGENYTYKEIEAIAKAIKEGR